MMSVAPYSSAQTSLLVLVHYIAIFFFGPFTFKVCSGTKETQIRFFIFLFFFLMILFLTFFSKCGCL